MNCSMVGRSVEKERIAWLFDVNSALGHFRRHHHPDCIVQGPITKSARSFLEMFLIAEA